MGKGAANEVQWSYMQQKRAKFCSSAFTSLLALSVPSCPTFILTPSYYIYIYIEYYNYIYIDSLIGNTNTNTITPKLSSQLKFLSQSPRNKYH